MFCYVWYGHGKGIMSLVDKEKQQGKDPPTSYTKLKIKPNKIKI